MTGLILVIIFLIIFTWLFTRDRRSPAEKQRVQENTVKRQQFSFEYPQLQRLINESLQIINSTKNVDTAIGRFDSIKQYLQRLLEIAPEEANVSISIQGHTIRRITELNQIDVAKREWIRVFYKTKADIELQKVNLLSSPKLKTAQLKKALNVVLKGVEHLPNDVILQGIISSIDEKLNASESAINKKKSDVKEWSAVFRRAIKDGVLTDDEMIELREHEQRLGLTEDDTKSYWEKAAKVGIDFSVANKGSL